MPTIHEKMDLLLRELSRKREIDGFSEQEGAFTVFNSDRLNPKKQLTWRTHIEIRHCGARSKTYEIKYTAIFPISFSEAREEQVALLVALLNERQLDLPFSIDSESGQVQARCENILTAQQLCEYHICVAFGRLQCTVLNNARKMLEVIIGRPVDLVLGRCQHTESKNNGRKKGRQKDKRSPIAAERGAGGDCEELTTEGGVDTPARMFESEMALMRSKLADAYREKGMRVTFVETEQNDPKGDSANDEAAE